MAGSRGFHPLRSAFVSELRRTTCNRDCPDACSIVATVEDGKVVRLAGDHEHPVTRGFLCYRTSAFSPARSIRPTGFCRPCCAVRTANLRPSAGTRRSIFAPRAFPRIRDESGPAAIFHYRSGGSLGLLKHLTDYFFEKFGPVTVEARRHLLGRRRCRADRPISATKTRTISSISWKRRASCSGARTCTSRARTRFPCCARRRSAARTLVLDRSRSSPDGLALPTITCSRARPATLRWRWRWRGCFSSAAGSIPRRRATAIIWTSFARSPCRVPSPSWCARCRRAVAEAAGIWRERLGPGKPCAILVGWGMGRRKAGGAIVRALDALSAISGNIGIAGGGVSFYYKRRGAFDLGFIRGKAAAPRTLCEPLFGQEVLAAARPAGARGVGHRRPIRWRCCPIRRRSPKRCARANSSWSSTRFSPTRRALRISSCPPPRCSKRTICSARMGTTILPRRARSWRRRRA